MRYFIIGVILFSTAVLSAEELQLTSRENQALNGIYYQAANHNEKPSYQKSDQTYRIRFQDPVLGKEGWVLEKRIIGFIFKPILFNPNHTDVPWQYGWETMDGYPTNLEIKVHSMQKKQVINFAALLRENGIELQWVTEAEIDNQGFIIERRKGDTDWQFVASYKEDHNLKGHGTTLWHTKYSYLDQNADLMTDYFYRISEVNLENSVEELGVVHVQPQYSDTGE